MLVKKSDIIGIDMVDTELKVLDENGQIIEIENNFCVRFHLKSKGYIVIPCFYCAGFGLDDEPEGKAAQLRLTQDYLDSHTDDNCYVELNAGILYGMDVYH